MPKEVINTRDAAVQIGWPSDDNADRYVQLGVTYDGDSEAWVRLDSPAQIMRLRRELGRASRRVFGIE